MKLIFLNRSYVYQIYQKFVYYLHKSFLHIASLFSDRAFKTLKAFNAWKAQALACYATGSAVRHINL